jgi:peptidoglycan-N-acetylglucosamine deacetylase
MPFRVALTFDAEHPDRPHRPGGTMRVLDTLAEGKAIASFFLQGRWVEAEPRVAQEIARRGHLIGNHSFYHARMPLLSPSGFRADVRAAERAIVRHTGVDPRPWFRCPFGAGTDDATINGLLAALSYRETGWDVDVADWRIAATGPGVASAVVAAVRSRGDGAVVLLHPWSRASGRGLGTIIATLRDLGASFVRLDALA